MFENEIMVNYQSNKIIISDESEILLESRSETLIEIKADYRADTILIINQEIISSVMCCNAVKKVKNKKVLVSFINLTENRIYRKVPDLKELNHEEFREASIHAVHSEVQEDNRVDARRISQLEEALRMDHLNSEEKESLKTICKEYSDVFFLQYDKLTATTPVALEIRTPEFVTPIHVKPYRLPQ